MNKTLLDVIQLSLMLIFWIAPAFILWISGIWKGGLYWFIWWSGLGIALGITELLTYLFTKRTLTQHLTKWAKESPRNKWLARLVLLLWTLGWLVLIWHLWV